MSRMRDALKNLEARFPSAAPVPEQAAAKGVVIPPAEPHFCGPLGALVDAACAHVVVQPVINESARVALAQPAARPPQPSLSDYLEQRTAARPEETPLPPPAIISAAPPSAAPQVTDADAPQWKLNSPRQPATQLELTIGRLLADPKYADAYGDLVDRLELDFSQRHVHNFALAAIESWRGQAELALGIAAMLADRGGDVLLVDGGSSGATLSFELGHARSPGLSQWLAAPSSWSKWVQATSLRNLYFLPAGSGDLPADADWPQALHGMRGTFRAVIFNAIEAPPARLELLTRAATATYLAVPLGLAETLPAQQTLARLRSKGARVLGCIAAQAASS